VKRWGLGGRGCTLPNYKQEMARCHERELGTHCAWVNASQELTEIKLIKDEWGFIGFLFFCTHLSSFQIASSKAWERRFSLPRPLDTQSRSSSNWTHNPDPHQTACHGDGENHYVISCVSFICAKLFLSSLMFGGVKVIYMLMFSQALTKLTVRHII